VIASFVKRLWGHPLSRGVNVNDAHAVERHRQILRSNALLRSVYLRWYQECMPAYEATKGLEGDIVEIGSGAGFLDEEIPGLIKTDVVRGPSIQKIVDAMNMDFEDEQLRAIFMIGVLHHLPFPSQFLAEAQRCLKRGGRLIMIEPNNSLIERVLCRVLDHYEYWDDSIGDWTNEAASRMTKANLALSWVILVRDRKRFEAEFPALKVLDIRYHTFLSYILSGGMSYRPFLPAFCLPAVKVIEALANPFMRNLGTLMTVEIEKV